MVNRKRGEDEEGHTARRCARLETKPDPLLQADTAAGDCRSGGGGDEAGNRRGRAGQDEGKDDKLPLNSRASQVQSCNGGVFLITSKGCVNRETSGDTIRANVHRRTGCWKRESLTLRLDVSGALTMASATAGPG